MENTKRDYDPRVTPEDRALLDAIAAELKRPDLSRERRSELIEESLGIANAYVALDILGDDTAAKPAAA